MLLSVGNRCLLESRMLRLLEHETVQLSDHLAVSLHSDAERCVDDGAGVTASWFIAGHVEDTEILVHLLLLQLFDLHK